MRTGPGEQYPIKWTYRRPGLPVEVTRRVHHWRRVRDWQGAEGWMHSSMLSGKRSIMVIGDVRTLRAQPDAPAPAVARIEGTVIGKLLRLPEERRLVPGADRRRERLAAAAARCGASTRTRRSSS